MTHFTFPFVGYFLLIAAIYVQDKYGVAEGASLDSNTARIARQSPYDQLPGRSKPLGKQCIEAKSGTYVGVCSISKPAKFCEDLVCATSAIRGDTMRDSGSIGPALDGSTCGPNKICLNKYCIDDPSPPSHSSSDTDTQDGCVTEPNLDYPGRYITFGELCQELGYAGICKTTDMSKQCSNIMCAESTGGSSYKAVDSGQAPNGAFCGQGNMYCVDGTCFRNANPPPSNYVIKKDNPLRCT